MSTYLITQATGQQSQAVIKHLLKAGNKVHAVVRDPQKQLPEVLSNSAVTVFKGDSTDFDSIFKAAHGCTGVFLNTFPIPGIEGQQARTVVDAAKKAGVESIVAATTIITDKKDMWDNKFTKETAGLSDYYISKNEIETVVRGGGFKSYTILRPGVIHHDYYFPGCLQNHPELQTKGVFDHAFNEGVRMVQTDCQDIGRYAAAAFNNPVKFNAQEIDLANEALTAKEISAILSRVAGRNIPARKRTPEEIEEAKMTVHGQRFQIWANEIDLSGVAAAAKDVQTKYGIPFTPLEEALQRDKAKVLDCLPAST